MPLDGSAASRETVLSAMDTLAVIHPEHLVMSPSKEFHPAFSFKTESLGQFRQGVKFQRVPSHLREHGLILHTHGNRYQSLVQLRW